MKAEVNRKMLNLVMHLLGWGIIFGLPLLGNRETHAMDMHKYAGYTITTFAFVVMFYLNYFLLIDEFLFRKRTIVFAILNLISLFIIDIICDMIRYYYIELNSVEMVIHNDRPPLIMIKLRDYMMMTLMVGLAVAIKTTDKWFQMEAEKKEIEKAKVEAELQNLKSQLNPHFLFNTLNNIYSLVSLDQEKARVAIDGFSKLLRYVLYDNNNQFVPLEKEISFMKSYIELMYLRLSDNIKISVDLPLCEKNIHVAPLLFMTFVENAYKHGVSSSKPSFINIKMSVKDNRLTFIVENSNYPKADHKRNSSGIGIKNLGKRLEMIYPGKYSLYTGTTGDKYISRLILYI